jgi:protein-S-isoprenylcysteine O-methyltransferase Ste14
MLAARERVTARSREGGRPVSTPVRVALTFAVGSAIFVALPLLAWGPGDLGGFLADPARAAYVTLALALNAYASVRIPEVGKPRGKAQRVVRRQRFAVLLLQVVPLAIVAGAPCCDRRGLAVISWPEVRWAGVALYAAGFLLMHRAEAHLGRLFSVQVAIQERHRLVTDGPYRLVRHPRYVGIIVFVAGLALVFRSWPALALAAVVKLVLLWRIRDEEALMAEEFGAEWDAYARRTWRLAPFVY